MPYLMLLESGHGVDDSFYTSPDFTVVMGQRSAGHIRVTYFNLQLNYLDITLLTLCLLAILPFQ